jgi:hypothetical protein
MQLLQLLQPIILLIFAAVRFADLLQPIVLLIIAAVQFAGFIFIALI